MATAGTLEMGRVTVEVELANNEDLVLANRQLLEPGQIRRMTISGIVDTGAAKLVLPASAVAGLGLPKGEKVGVRYADHRTAERDVAQNVWLKLCGRSSVFSAVLEPNRQDALIGAIVMEELDLIVDCARNEVRPRDPDHIISEIEELHAVPHSD